MPSPPSPSAWLDIMAANASSGWGRPPDKFHEIAGRSVKLHEITLKLQECNYSGQFHDNYTSSTRSATRADWAMHSPSPTPLPTATRPTASPREVTIHRRWSMRMATRLAARDPPTPPQCPISRAGRGANPNGEIFDKQKPLGAHGSNDNPRCPRQSLSKLRNGQSQHTLRRPRTMIPTRSSRT